MTKRRNEMSQSVSHLQMRFWMRANENRDEMRVKFVGVAKKKVTNNRVK